MKIRKMHFFYLSLIASFSIALAVIIGLVRYSKINQAYRPFVIICIVALCNELLSLLMLKRYGTNSPNANIYVWVEFILFLWLFSRWGSFNKKSWHFPLVAGALTLIWIYDNLVWNSLGSFNSLFRICYSFCLIFLSIDQINKLIVKARGGLLRNSRFLICIGIIIFYSYKATIEVFYLLKLSFSNTFYDNIFLILSLVNLFVNLVYALAVIWIPKKQKFILPY
jgi:hypothetical protein